MLLVLFSVSAHSICTHQNNVPSCFTKMAFWQLMHLGRWCTITYCWYQWTNDDHFIYQGFPNNAKGRELGILPLGQANHILQEGKIILQCGGNLRRIYIYIYGWTGLLIPSKMLPFLVEFISPDVTVSQH